MQVFVGTADSYILKLKIKNYLRSSMSQNRLTNLTIISIESMKRVKYRRLIYKQIHKYNLIFRLYFTKTILIGSVVDLVRRYLLKIHKKYKKVYMWPIPITLYTEIGGRHIYTCTRAPKAPGAASASFTHSIRYFK